MGISFSCPFSEYNDVENNMETIIVNSISFGNDDVKTPMRSVSFNGRDLEPTIMKSLGSGRMALEASVSFKGRALEKTISIKKASLLDEEEKMTKEMDNQSSRSETEVGLIRELQVLDPTNSKHVAALKLQKVYKSFRTRRKLADCAVLVEQSWWKVLDFAELKRSSISFFDIEKQETAISRWSRARTRAAKVGKGLSKNDKAQKLALQHWLEAIDPRHRLDIGQGKEVNLLEKCPRTKLQQQCIKYLGPMERLAYEVIVEGGKFFHKQSGKLIDTAGEDEGAKWIFVLSTSKTLYVGKKKKGTFQHSSFLAGGATSAAGRLVLESGILKAVWPHSGHYRPTEENFRDFISFLGENNVDLTDVKMSPVDEEDDSLNKQKNNLHHRMYSSKEDPIQKMSGLEGEEITAEQHAIGKSDIGERKTSSILELTKLEILSRDELIETVKQENEVRSRNCNGCEKAEETITSKPDFLVLKRNLFDEEHEDNEVETVPEESILKRLNSHKGMKSYQLGKQLTCKWTTGAGPRIGCVKDYPSELRVLALEQVSLSPKSAARSRAYFSPRLASGLSPRVSKPASQG